MNPRPRVAFLAQLGVPGRYDPALFAHLPGGDDEAHWMARRLDALGLAGRLTYVARRLALGEPPPEPEEAEAAILGGSFHSVHDDLPHQRAVLAWLRRWRAAGRPLLGICGGHQLMGRWAGVQVEAVPRGPLNGSLPVTPTPTGAAHAMFDGLDRDGPVFHFGNEERLAGPPEGAAVLATRPELPAAALDHGGGWWSVQFHPEADEALFQACRPESRRNWRPLPHAPLLLRNFLAGTGVIAP